MLVLLKDMMLRGKVINVVFVVSVVFVFGSYFGFVVGMKKEMVVVMMIGKLVGGIIVVVVVVWMIFVYMVKK